MFRDFRSIFKPICKDFGEKPVDPLRNEVFFTYESKVAISLVSEFKTIKIQRCKYQPRQMFCFRSKHYPFLSEILYSETHI